MGSCLPEGASCRLAFVAAEIVEDDDIAFGEGRSQYLLDIEGEEFAVDGAIDDPRGIDAIDPQGCELGVLAGPAEWASDDALALVRAALQK